MKTYTEESSDEEVTNNLEDDDDADIGESSVRLAVANQKPIVWDKYPFDDLEAADASRSLRIQKSSSLNKSATSQDAQGE